MDTDVVGVSSVATLIENSGKSKFIIRRTGAVKSAPIWEYTGVSSSKAKQEFINWANTLQTAGKNCNSYSITLFNESDEEEGTKKKGDKPFVFTFALSSESNYYNEDRSGKKEPQHISEILAAMELKFQAMLKEKEESEISKRLKEIEDRLNEEEDDSINGEEQPSELMNILGTIAGLVQGAKSPASAINGATPLNEEKIKSINSSIKRLYAIDPELDSDLKILANLGESNPKQFKFLLNTLRNM